MGQNLGRCIFKILGNKYWRELKTEYYYYDTFLTTDLDLIMKYKLHISFHEMKWNLKSNVYSYQTVYLSITC